MTLSDTHRELIESLEGHTCLYSSLNTYRPHAPKFENCTFQSWWILEGLDWGGNGGIVDIQIQKSNSQIIITTCDDDSDARIDTYIFTR